MVFAVSALKRMDVAPSLKRKVSQNIHFNIYMEKFNQHIYGRRLVFIQNSMEW